MKLFMKDARVKMSENLSSWALQSGGEKGQSQEPRVGGPASHSSSLPAGWAPNLAPL